MNEPIDRPGVAANGGRGSAVRRGFEVYTPAGRGGNKSSGGDGHDLTRGRSLWEDTEQAARLPKGDKEWKRDRWDEDDDQVSQANTSRSARGGSGSAATRGTRTAAQAAEGSAPRGRGGVRKQADRAGMGATGASPSTSAAPTGVEVELPSGDQYEDISRRVEEEVVAKLARAQMMGMMLKAHREQEEEGRRGGARGGGGGRRRRGSHRDDGEWDRGSAGDRDRDRQRDRSRGIARGGAGGSNMAAPRQLLSRHADAASGRGGGGKAGRGPTSTPTPRQNHVSAGTRLANGKGAPTIGDRQYPQLSTHSADEENRRKNGTGARPAGVLRVPLQQVIAGSKSLLSASGDSPLEDLGADPDGMEVDEAYAVVGKLERQHKALLDELRKDAGQVGAGHSEAVVSVSGPSAVAAATAAAAAAERARQVPAAAGLSGRLTRIRGALSRALGSLILRDGSFSLRKRLPNRLWMAHYRELEVVQQRVRQLGGVTATGNSVPQQQQKQVQELRARLFVLIEAAESNISEMVEAMEDQIAAAEEEKQQAAAAATKSSPASGLRDGGELSEGGGDGDSAIGGGVAGSDEDSDEDNDSSSEEDQGRRQALQAFLTSLGDLARYRGMHGDLGGTTGSAGGVGGEMGGWARAEGFYLRALRVDPSSGKVWNQMAVLSSCRGDNLEAFYAYLRGVCAVTPFPTGRENLLVLHEKCKARLSTLREATALDALGLEEHQARFRLYLLGACGTCLSRVDLGTFDGYLALAERHMVSCIQLHLMRPTTGHRSGNPAAGERMGNGRCRDGGAGTSPADGGKGLEGTLARAIILCVCTASASIEAWRSRGMEGGSWTQDAATSRAVRLCLSLAGSLAGLHRKTSMRGWEKLTAAGVGIFLDWLTCQPQFGEGARGTRPDEFQHVMACVVEFANGVIRAAAVESADRLRVASGRSSFSSRNDRGAVAPEGTADEIDIDPDGPLWEDEECRGLPALETVTERRAAKARKRARLLTQQHHDHQPISSEASGGGGGAVEPWRTRVARLRKQVEFCVERGWIARGVTANTYTLPKPPSRRGSSRSPRDDVVGHNDSDDGLPPLGGQTTGGRPPPDGALLDVGFPLDDQPPPGAGKDGVRAGDDRRSHDRRGGTGTGSLWLEGKPNAVASIGVGGSRRERDDAAGRTGGGEHWLPSPPRAPLEGGANAWPRQPRVPIVPPGHRHLSSSPRMTGTASAAGAGPSEDNGAVQATDIAVAQALSSLHVKSDARESGGVDRIVSDAAVTGEAGDSGGEGRSTEKNEDGAIFTEEFGEMAHQSQSTGDVEHPTRLGRAAGARDGLSFGNEAAVLSAGLPVGTDLFENNGHSDKDSNGPLPESLMGIVMAGLGSADDSLCAYCCATLNPSGPGECPVCGTPTPSSLAPAGGPDATVTPPADSLPTGECSEVVEPQELEVQERLPTGLPEKRPVETAVSATMARGAAGPASATLPAGVLAVNNLAEVLASSQARQSHASPTAVARAAAQGASNNRSRNRDSRNPSAIARAGLGDGSRGGGGRGGSVVTSGGKMFGWPRGAPRAAALPLVVIDVPNVAMRHGLNKKFSCKGVQMALEYFRTAGHRVLGFLPDYYLDETRTHGLERAKKLGVADVKASRLPDDVQMLKAMVDDGLIIATPPQDYDDSYCIKYAMAREGYVVTNDLYRDHVKGVDGRKKADAARRWIKSHSISYTFVGDEFFPNPDFSFQQDQKANVG